jgi:hypothetical protein
LKCTPAYVRLSPASIPAARKLGYERTPTSGAPCELALKGKLVPRKVSSTYTATPVLAWCPEGYSGCAGVDSSGVQVGSKVGRPW